jgi:tetratricopeptide (TPR) repeat protein
MEMKQRIIGLMTVLMFVAIFAVPSFAQTSMVQGTVRDSEGKPVAGAVVEYQNLDTGQTYHIKTDKKGHYLSLGIVMGQYKVILMENGKQVYSLNNIHVDLDEAKNVTDIDLKKEQELAAKGVGISPEQLKKMQEAKAKQEQQNNLIKGLNDKLAAANQAVMSGDFDSAIKILTDASQMDPNQDVIWGRLGEVYSESAAKQTDATAKTERYTQAAASFQKAIDAKEKILGSTAPNAAAQSALGSYYNNMGEAYGKVGKTDEAIQAYEQAAKINPSQAGQYYYNEGAVLTNSGKTDAAITAFDKCIAADPNRADAYYWKGVDMLGKATLKGDKMVAPDGTAEAFNKYLELKPDGPFAGPAKQMLASIGAPVQTTYGKKSKAAKR